MLDSLSKANAFKVMIIITFVFPCFCKFMSGLRNWIKSRFAKYVGQLIIVN